jgi:hypothetical protein
MQHDDRSLERLLARGHLSGAEYDRIETRVLDRVARPGKPGRGRWLVVAAPVVAAAAGLALCITGLRAPADPSGGFTPKGTTVTTIDGAVELVCSGDARPCRVGDTLMFLVDSSVASGYLNATATRIAPPSEERYVLFPSAGGQSPYVASGSGTVVVPQGIRIGAQHGAGLFRVEVSFFERGAALAPRLAGTTSVDLKVVE